MIVGLAETVMTLECKATEVVERDGVGELDGGRVVLGMTNNITTVARPDGELEVEGLRYVPGGLLIALKPFGHVDMTHDVGGGMTALARIVEDRRCAERVVVMAVRVDHIANRQISDGPKFTHNPRAAGEQSGIHHRYTLGPNEKRGVAESSEEMHARRNLLALAPLRRGGERLGAVQWFRRGFAHQCAPVVAVWTFNEVSRMRELYIQPSGSDGGPDGRHIPGPGSGAERQ